MADEPNSDSIQKYNDGFSDGLNRMLGCLVGPLPTLKGRCEAITVMLTELKRTIHVQEHKEWLDKLEAEHGKKNA